jgi:hypothetical protein
MMVLFVVGSDVGVRCAKDITLAPNFLKLIQLYQELEGNLHTYTCTNPN